MKTLSGYTDETSLTEILELLTLHCSLMGLDNPKVQIILPKTVLDAYSLTFSAKERIRFLGEPQPDPEEVELKTLYTCDGIVELFSDEKASVLIKE